MNFGFSEEQTLFAGTVRDLLEKECTPALLRERAGGPAGHWPELWSRLAEVGVLGLRVPEGNGGVGGTELDLVLVLEECGRAAVPGPLMETVAVAAPLLAEVGHGGRWLPAIAAGDAVVSVALDAEPFASGAAGADLLLIQSGDAVHAVPPDRATLTPQSSLDPTRAVAAVGFDPSGDTRIASGAAGSEALTRALDRGALGVAAQLVGLAERMIEMAAAYALDRRQFGRPIGSFQAVKGLLADALVRLEFARPVVYRAAHSIAMDAPDRSRDASMAKAAASDAAALAARASLQVHGAIGYTEEHDLHLWLRRTRALAWSWGTAARHRERVARSVLGPA